MSGQWWIEDRSDLPDGNYELPERTVAGTLNDSGDDKWSLDTIGSVSGQPLHDPWPQTPRPALLPDWRRTANCPVAPYSASSAILKWTSMDMGFILRLNASIVSEEPPSILRNSNRLNSGTSSGEILGKA